MTTAWPSLPSIRELIKLYGLSAKSQLGQNFILDKNITDKIVRTARLTPRTSLVVEVGPGPGLLTRSILDATSSGCSIVSIEKDRRFLPTLQQLSEASHGRFHVVQGDMLKMPHEDILKATRIDQLEKDEPIHIMGNLPFNVASPLLLQWLRAMVAKEGLFGLGHQVHMTLMFQREVANRLSAEAGDSDRGRFAVMAQSICHVKTVYNVPSTVFVPPPKVDASVVQLIPRQDIVSMDRATYEALENVLRYFFTKRRKTIGHILKRLGDDIPEAKKITLALQDLVNVKARPADVSTETYCRLSQLIQESGVVIPSNLST